MIFYSLLTHRVFMIIATPWPCTCLNLSKFQTFMRSYEISKVFSFCKNSFCRRLQIFTVRLCTVIFNQIRCICIDVINFFYLNIFRMDSCTILDMIEELLFYTKISLKQCMNSTNDRRKILKIRRTETHAASMIFTIFARNKINSVSGRVCLLTDFVIQFQSIQC